MSSVQFAGRVFSPLLISSIAMSQRAQQVLQADLEPRCLLAKPKGFVKMGLIRS